MEIQCGACGKTYRIDERKLKKGVSRFRCKSCTNILTVNYNPDAAAAVEPPVFDSETAVAAGAGTGREDDSAGFKRPVARTSGARYAVSDEQSVEAPGDRSRGAAGDQEDQDDSVPVSKVRFGLTPKLIILMMILSLAPLGLFWGLSLKATSQRIRLDTGLLMEQTAEGLGRQVDEWLDKNILAMKIAARLADIQSMDRWQQEAVLKSIQAEYPWMYLVFTVDLEGQNVARSDGKPLKDYSDRQYYKDIAQGKTLTWQTLIGKTSKKPALVLAVPIKRDNALVGVMASAMNIDEISKNVARWKKGKTGFAFLVDEKGKVVAHQLKAFVLTQQNLNAHPLVSAFRQKKSPTSIGFNDENGIACQGHARGNEYGWVLGVQQQDEEVFKPLKQVQMFALVVLLATVVIVILVSWLTARTVVKPVTALTEVAERMSMGDLNVQISVNSKDEIGLLAQAIGRMQISLRMALKRLRNRYRMK